MPFPSTGNVISASEKARDYMVGNAKNDLEDIKNKNQSLEGSSMQGHQENPKKT